MDDEKQDQIPPSRSYEDGTEPEEQGEQKKKSGSNPLDQARKLRNLTKSIRGAPKLPGGIPGAGGLGGLGGAGGVGAAGTGGAAGGVAGGAAAASATTAPIASGGVAATVSGGWIVLIVLAVLLLIFIIIVILKGKNSANNGVTVKLTKTAPAEVDNGENILYSLNVSYTGSPNQIVVTDVIPENTTFVSAGQNAKLYDASGQETTTASQVKKVVWTITGSGGGTSGGSGGPTATTDPPNPNASSFEEMMKGQARNTGVLGDENSFIETIFTNVNPSRPLGNRSAYENNVRTLYKTALQYNINPLVLLAMWGVETSFSTSGVSFGCKIHSANPPQGFPAQVSCSANNLNELIVEFEEKAKNGSPVSTPNNGANCKYDDAFIYAYERYTPICEYQDGNSSARTNFMAYIKDFLTPGAQ